MMAVFRFQGQRQGGNQQFFSAAVDKWDKCGVYTEALTNRPVTRIERYHRSARQHDGGNHRPTAKA